MGWSKKIDTGVSKTLFHERIQTRPGASPGTWLILLLPVAVIATALTRKVSYVHALCAIFSGNLLLNGFVLLLHMRLTSSFSVTKSFNLYVAIPVAISGILYNRYLELDVFRAVCHSIANSLIYFESVPCLLKLFPKSFSFGEANVAAQTLSLFIYSTFVWCNEIAITQAPFSDIDIITTNLQIILVTVLLICLIPRTWSHTLQLLVASSMLGGLVPLLNFVLQKNIILWTMEFICSHSRLRLVSWWAACSGLAWGTVVLQIRSKQKATSDVRKVFHFLAVLVFLSGALVDPPMLYFASGLVLPLFLLIEFVRVHNLTPFAKALQDGFHVYADEKDAGGVALTPIYLLMGCSVPFWLAPSFTAPLPLLSGVLSIGVGDSFASVIGKSLGKHKWSGSKKSVEGSIGCFLGQLIAILLMSSFGLLPVINHNVAYFVKPVLAIAVNSLIEAKTDQVDNLVLPLVTYIILIL